AQAQMDSTSPVEVNPIGCEGCGRPGSSRAGDGTSIRAFRAGCVMIVAALEAMLLLTACALEADLREKGLWLEKPFLRWDLGDLLGIAAKAGWLPKSDASF